MGGVRILELLAPAVPVEAVDWEAVYREEMPRVFNYFRYRGFERATAEDLTSATFEKAWRARERYRKDRAAVSTWLLAIAPQRRDRPLPALAPRGAARGGRRDGRGDAGDGGPARRAIPSARRAAAGVARAGAGAAGAQVRGGRHQPCHCDAHRAQRVERGDDPAPHGRLARDPGGTKEDHSERRFPVPAPRGAPARVQGPSGGPTARDRRAGARAARRRRARTGASRPRSPALRSPPRSPSLSRWSRCGPPPASSSTSSG